MGKSRSKFTREFKLEAVKQVIEQDVGSLGIRDKHGRLGHAHDARAGQMTMFGRSRGPLALLVRPDIERIFNYRQDQLHLLEAEWKATPA